MTATARSVVRRLSVHATVGFLILLACYGYFLPRFDNVNSSSRIDLVYAVADQGTLRIDDYHINTIDKAYYQGHYYTEKSIGPSVVALPAYVAFRTVAVTTGLAEPPETDGSGTGYPRRYHGMAVTVVTFLTVSIPAAAAAAALYAFVRRWVSAPFALATMLTYGLATIAFPFSSQFFSHQLAAAALFTAFFVLWRVTREGARPSGAWLAGALLGFSVVTEYVTAVLAALIVAWTLFEGRDLRVAARIVAAAAPWALLAAGYNLAAFGTPLPVGYAHTVHFADVHVQGFMGLTAPTWERLYGITVSPYRGLFFLSPFLLLSLPGFALMWRAGERALVALLAGIAALLVAYNASYVMWSGGFSIGPRHLVPMLPFLCVPVAWALRSAWQNRAGKVLVAVLVGLSAANVWIQSIGGFDFPADTIERPLTAYSLPHLLRGDVALNVGMVLGLEGLPSLLPLAGLVAIIVLGVPRIISGTRARAIGRAALRGQGA